MTSELDMLREIVELARPHGNWRNPTLKAAIERYDDSKRKPEPATKDDEYDGREW